MRTMPTWAETCMATHLPVEADAPTVLTVWDKQEISVATKTSGITPDVIYSAIVDIVIGQYNGMGLVIDEGEGKKPYFLSGHSEFNDAGFVPILFRHDAWLGVLAFARKRNRYTTSEYDRIIEDFQLERALARPGSMETPDDGPVKMAKNDPTQHPDRVRLREKMIADGTLHELIDVHHYLSMTRRNIFQDRVMMSSETDQITDHIALLELSTKLAKKMPQTNTWQKNSWQM